MAPGLDQEWCGQQDQVSLQVQCDQKSRLSRSLIPLLPQLLEKFSVVSALLELLQHLELGMLRSARMDKFLEQVLERILAVSRSHSRPFPGLSAASRALRRLWHPELALGRLGDIARARLGDGLGTGATPR
ncbi:hypothetical protein DUI87_35632 [Hirundo rustica rustica]|uniref:Cohesin subunit SCC3/SA HEAT-repeats domain-containing protein n=1 Tax=Hirundo rustica rustica TaxID=333673 RepID=A0A3M0IGW2_HIRRU|nr:hypothetical protein DUI87_35632 [Hirundo rustica rustica]